jgi:hypothetical protein
MRPLIVYSQLNAFFPVKVETGVLDSRPKLLRFHMPDPTAHPKHQVKRMAKAEKEDLVHSSRHTVERDRISTQLIFSHLWDAVMSYRFK